jgi:carboxylesterase
MIIVQNEGEPFFFKGGPIGCLLVHGLTGAPKEMRWLGEYLANEGHTVLGCRLFAHATDQKDMLRARWYDWFSSLEDGYHLLQNSCNQIFVMGLSMGGILSLLFGAHYPVAGIVACSTPYTMPDKLALVLRPIIPIIAPFWRYAPKGEPDWVEKDMAKDHLEYPSYPLRAVTQLHQLLKEMRKNLSQLEMPVLLIHSKKDAGVPYQHAQRIYEHLGSSDKEIFWLENSGHVVVRDADRERVFQAAASFVRRVSSQESQPTWE